jgi:pimeloyl-ACP methyl ester carboxylesterase
MEERVEFVSDKLRLSGVLHHPESRGVPNAAFMVLHGFGSNKDGGGSKAMAAALTGLGYAALRFDFRGCGESEGERGRVICKEQVKDTRNALSFLASRADIDPRRIGVVGQSFGAAVAVYSAGVDRRIAACISSGGWGDGAKKFRKQHASPRAWAKFSTMMKEGKRRKRAGKPMMVPRYDIVPIPQHVRDNLARQSVEMFTASHVEMFPAETVQSMFDFRAEDVVGRIAPRPLLLIHSASDSVTPTEQSIELFRRAGQPSELHLFSGLDHFLFAENSARVWGVMRDWLRDYFPVRR